MALFDADELVEEASSFPNGAHDDQVDAASQALAELLLDGNGAQAWIAWMKRKAEQAAAGASAAPEAAGPEDQAAELAAATRRATALASADLHECGKPDCARLVSVASVYCCKPCSDAAIGQYEIGAHSPQCDERAAERAGDTGPTADAPAAPLDPVEARRQARTAMMQQQGARGW